MKTIVNVVIVWALTAPICYGQVRGVEAGSAEAAARFDKYRREMAKEKSEHKSWLELGQDLFGADKRWAKAMEGKGKGDAAGTLISKYPGDFRIGEWGCFKYPFTVVQKISQNECLVYPGRHYDEVMLLRGPNMSKVTDGAKFILQHPVTIRETFSYTAVSGGQKTVLVIELLGKPKQIPVEQQWRTWTAANGKSTTEGRFIEFKNFRVQLEKRDGKVHELPMSSLSKADQQWVRDELKRRREGEVTVHGNSKLPRK